MTVLDWPTLRVVAEYYGTDPHEIERSLSTEDRDAAPSRDWCEMPLHRYDRGLCSRTAQQSVAGIRMCWQHENTFLNSVRHWLSSTADVRDLQIVVDAILSRVEHLRMVRDKPQLAMAGELEFDARLRTSLHAYLATDAESLTRQSLTQIWG